MPVGWRQLGQCGLSQSLLAFTESDPQGPVPQTGSPIEQPQLRSRRSTKWGLEDNTACYGQEKMSI